MSTALKERPVPVTNGLTLEEVTPDLAKQWLGSNPKNRRISAVQVQRLAAAIKKGEWQVNGETIKLTDSGDLLDGQHRLLAIVEAKRPVWSYVVRGVDPDTSQTIDLGRRRNVGDLLQMAGEPRYSILGAALGQLHIYKMSGIFGSGGNKGTPSTLLALLEKNPGIRDWIDPTMGFARGLRFNPGMAVAMWYVFGDLDRDLALDFADKLTTGHDLTAGSPILTLREQLIADLSSSPRMLPGRRAEITIRSWNALRKGLDLKQLRGTNKEYPRPE